MIRRKILVFAVAAGLSAMSLGAQAAPRMAVAPSASSLAAEPLAVSGWAIDEHGIDRVGLYLDGELYANEIAYGISRLDVAHA